MKALIGRDTDGWGTRGLIARLDNGQIVRTATAVELVRQLRAIGVTAIKASGSDDGDWSLSDAARQSVLDAWQREISES